MGPTLWTGWVAPQAMLLSRLSVAACLGTCPTVFGRNCTPGAMHPARLILICAGLLATATLSVGSPSDILEWMYHICGAPLGLVHPPLRKTLYQVYQQVFWCAAVAKYFNPGVNRITCATSHCLLVVSVNGVGKQCAPRCMCECSRSSCLCCPKANL